MKKRKVKTQITFKAYIVSKPGFKMLREIRQKKQTKKIETKYKVQR